MQNASNRESALIDYKPSTDDKPESIAAKSNPPKSFPDMAAHSPGARVTPQYIERNPQMWAVGEVDVRAIKDDSFVANVSLTIGGFFLGLAVNILVSYVGTDRLTDIGSLMLHKAAPLCGVLALFFGIVGFVMNRKRNQIWEQIKKESRPHQ